MCDSRRLVLSGVFPFREHRILALRQAEPRCCHRTPCDSSSIALNPMFAKFLVLVLLETAALVSRVDEAAEQSSSSQHLLLPQLAALLYAARGRAGVHVGGGALLTGSGKSALYAAPAAHASESAFFPSTAFIRVILLLRIEPCDPGTELLHQHAYTPSSAARPRGRRRMLLRRSPPKCARRARSTCAARRCALETEPAESREASACVGSRAGP